MADGARGHLSQPHSARGSRHGREPRHRAGGGDRDRQSAEDAHADVRKGARHGGHGGHCTQKGRARLSLAEQLHQAVAGADRSRLRRAGEPWLYIPRRDSAAHGRERRIYRLCARLFHISDRGALFQGDVGDPHRRADRHRANEDHPAGERYGEPRQRLPELCADLRHVRLPADGDQGRGDCNDHRGSGDLPRPPLCSVPVLWRSARILFWSRSSSAWGCLSLPA